jgi:spore coat protein U-like protein
MNMNKFAIATAIAAVFAGSTAIAAVAGPQTSGEIVIKGTVGELCEISVVDLGTNLNLVDGEQAARVGEITETCNNPEGYSVAFKSDNGGFMSGPLDAQSFYRINYDSIADFSLEEAGSLVRELPQWNAAYDLTVNVDGDDELPAGSYKDLVTVEIAAL